MLQRTLRKLGQPNVFLPLALLLLLGSCLWPFVAETLLWQDPRFVMSNLGGLTPDEVIQKLGPPEPHSLQQLRTATTHPGWGGDDPSNPLVLMYPAGRAVGGFAIDFVHNHVTNVRRWTR